MTKDQKRAKGNDRAKRFREAMKEAGFVQVSGWVPASQASDVTIVLDKMRRNPHLEIAVLRDTVTCRYVRKG